MLEWTVAIAMATALLIAVTLPGALVLRAMGARPAVALAGGPGLSIVVITAATVALPALGMRWTLGAAIILLLGVCGLSALPLLWCWWRLRRSGGVSSGMRHGTITDPVAGMEDDSTQDPAGPPTRMRPDSAGPPDGPPQGAAGGADSEPADEAEPVGPGEAHGADTPAEAETAHSSDPGARLAPSEGLEHHWAAVLDVLGSDDGPERAEGSEPGDGPEPEEEPDSASTPDAEDRLAPVTGPEAEGVRRPGKPLVLRRPSTAGTTQSEAWDWEADEEPVEPDWAPAAVKEPPEPAEDQEDREDEESAQEDAPGPGAPPSSPLSRLGALIGGYWRGSGREQAVGCVRDYWPAAVGLLAVAVPQIIVLSQAMGRPSAVFQNHDAMFHLNLIVEIERTGNASPLTSAIPVSGAAYYPNLWHVVAAVLPGVPPTTAFNIVLIMVAALLLPLGCILLVRAIGGGGAAMALAPFAASVTMWFPSLMLYYHGQASTALSIVLIPFALAAIVDWVRDKDRFSSLCAAASAVAGAAVAHAGAGQLLLIICAILGVLWSGQLAARRKRLRRLARLAAPLPAIAGLLVLAVMGSSSTLQAMGDYPRTEVPFGWALLNALSLAPLADTDDRWRHIVLAIAAVVGIGLLIARRHRAFIASWGVVLTLDLISVLPEGWWRAYVGGWWRDEARFRAVLAVLAGVLAAYALGCLATWSAQRLRRGSGQRAVGALGALSLVLAMGSIGQGSLAEDSLWAHRAYDVDYMTHTPWVDPGEELFMDYLRGRLPDDAVVYGYPASGAGLLPVLTDIDSFHRINSVGGDRPDKPYVARTFKEIRTDPRVCEIINNEGGTPLYYEDRTVHDREIKGEFPGYLGVDTSQGFELLATDGNASIWRITACDRGGTSR